MENRKTRMKIKGAVFDLDGTLLDSMFLWDSIGEEYLKSLCMKPKPGLREILRPMSLVQAAEYFRQNYGITESVEEITIGVNRMLERFYCDTVPIKNGVYMLLKKFQEKGVKMCVATATDRYLAKAALDRNGIGSFFECILTCGEVGRGKDHPDIFLHAGKALGTDKSETFVFEDSLYAIKTAKNAGFPVVAVYDASAAAQQDEIKSAADIYLKSYDSYEEWCDFL